MRIISIILLLFFSNICLGQNIHPVDTLANDHQESEPQKNSLLALPFAYYSPETRWAFGATGIYNFHWNKKDTITNPSQVLLGLAWTQNKQVLFYVPYQLYWQENEWRASGEIGYYRYSYDFFGIGNDNPNDFKENYEVNFPRIRTHVLRKLKPNFFLGLQYWYENFDINPASFDPAGQLISGRIIGSAGGQTAGIGLLALHDSRDNVYFPMSGYYIQGTIHSNSPYTLSDYSFDRYRMDVRAYRSFKKKHTFANRIFFDHITGQAPFTQLAFLGGPKKARGYTEGRFRDNNLLLAQTECRVHIWKRVGAVVFASYGMVASTPQLLTLNQSRFAYGGGLRLMTDVDKKVNLRVDYAITPLGNNFYVTFGEAF